jgi:hypothetical protein
MQSERRVWKHQTTWGGGARPRLPMLEFGYGRRYGLAIAWGLLLLGTLVVLQPGGLEHRESHIHAEVMDAVRSLASGDVGRHGAALQSLAARRDLWTLSIAEFLGDSTVAPHPQANRVLVDCCDTELPSFIREVHRAVPRVRAPGVRGRPGTEAEAGIDWFTHVGGSSHDYDWFLSAAESQNAEERAWAACWLPLMPWDGIEYSLPVLVGLLRDEHNPARTLARLGLGPASGVFLRGRSGTGLGEREFAPLDADVITTLCGWLAEGNPALVWAASRVVWMRRGVDVALVECVTEQLAQTTADASMRPWTRPEWLIAALEGEVRLSARARENLEHCLPRAGDMEPSKVALIGLCVAKLGLDRVQALLPDDGETSVIARASAAAAGDAGVITSEELRGLLRSSVGEVLELGVRAAVAWEGGGQEFAHDLAAWRATEIQEDREFPSGQREFRSERCPAVLAVAWGCAVLGVQRPEMLHLLSMALRVKGLREEAQRYLHDLSVRSTGGLDLDVSLVPLLWWEPESPMLSAVSSLLLRSTGSGFGVPEAAIAAFVRSEPSIGNRVSLVRLFRQRLASSASRWRHVTEFVPIRDPLLLYQLCRADAASP